MSNDEDSREQPKRPEAHEHDRLPTSSAIPGAAATGVWGPRGKDGSLLKPQDVEEGGAPGTDDPLEPPVK